MSRKQIVILGGGTGGTLTANRLRRRFDADEAEITRRRPGRPPRLPAGPAVRAVRAGARRTTSCAAADAQLHDGIDFLECGDRRTVDIDARRGASRRTGATLAYDVLVVATGAALVPEETEGLTGPGLDGEGLHLLHARGRRRAARRRSTRFDRGRLVVNVVDMPIKCPVAPLEFCFLADWYFPERGIRDQVELTYVTPLDGAFTKPVAAEQLGGLLEREGHRARHRVQHRRGRRRRRPARRLRRPRGRRSTCRRRPAARRRGVRRPLARARRRARLRRRPTSTRCSRGARRTSS